MSFSVTQNESIKKYEMRLVIWPGTVHYFLWTWKYICIECLLIGVIVYFLVCLNPYLNSIASRTGVSSYVLYFACPRFLFLFHGDPTLSPLSSSMYVGRVLIKLSDDRRTFPTSHGTYVRRLD